MRIKEHARRRLIGLVEVTCRWLVGWLKQKDCDRVDNKMFSKDRTMVAPSSAVG